MLINSTNLLLLGVFVLVCYAIWQPYIRGKKLVAIVEGFEHPGGEKEDRSKWCFKFSYRDGVSSKKQYCYSKRLYDTQDEMIAIYPKGAQVEIKRYDSGRAGIPRAVILSDKKDMYSAMLYTIFVLVGLSAMSIGYQLMLRQMMQ